MVGRDGAVGVLVGAAVGTFWLIPGHGSAQDSLSHLCENVAVSSPVKDLTRCAAQGNASAQYKLGLKYDIGEGAPEEIPENALVGTAFLQKLMLFGGPGHKTYLGCLSCSEYDSDSLFNPYGTYGSEYSRDSIFNKYGQFGSRYSNYSACNPYASDPPVIVDEVGGFFGRLTVNRYHSQAMGDAELLAWISGVCEG